MKNWKKASIGALCVMSLLAGCGMQGGDTNNNDKNADEPKEISLEQVRADNIPEKLLEDHDTVTVSIQGTDQDGRETYTAKVQYTRDDKGNLLLASHYSYTADSPVGEDEFFAQACLSIEGNGVYLSKMESDGRLNMNCYPSGEYESYIQEMLPSCGELQDDGSVETIDDQSEQDGAVVISTTTTYSDMPDYYFTTLYYVDPATGELLAKSVTDYSKDESGEASVLGTTLYDWSYGESYLPDKELAAEAFNSDEVCALTLVYNPGAADEETQEISIKRGTYVTFVSSTGNLLYADAELTQPLDDTVSIDTSGEEMTVENVRKQSRFHPRCGTSFIFVMIILSILVSSLVALAFPALTHIRPVWICVKVLIMPIVMGLGYEFIRYAGRHDNLFVNILSAPGLWMQRITTAEPDDSMIEVGIAAINAVVPHPEEKKENIEEVGETENISEENGEEN